MRVRVEGHDPAPPIRLFWSAFLLAVLLVVALYLVVPGEPSQQYREWFSNTARIDRPAAASDLKVVALGTSLMGCGLAFDGDMETLARSRGERISFTRLSRDSADLGWLVPLLSRISEHPPDLLVIEAELLAWSWDEPPHRVPHGLRNSLRESRKRLYNWILWQEDRLFSRGGASVIQRDWEMEAPAVERRARAVKGFDPAAYVKKLGTIRIRDNASLENLMPVLHALKSRGCVVVLLPMGRNPVAAALFPASLDLAFANSMEYFSRHGFMIAEPIRLPRDCYLDEAHLNEKGRGRASVEFLTRLPRWMEAKP